MASRRAFCPGVMALRTSAVCPGRRAAAGEERATVATDCSVVGTPLAPTLREAAEERSC